MKKPQAGRGRADVPRVAHAHARRRTRATRPTSTSTDRARAGAVGDELAGCSGAEPKDDPNTALFSIDVIQVPLAAPEKARIVSRPRIFADPATGAIAGLWQGGDHGPGTQKTVGDQSVPRHHGLPGDRPGRRRLLGQRHPARHLGSRESRAPRPGHRTRTSPTGTRRRSTTTASKVIFTDEWGGGTRPRCRATDPPNWGADAIFDIVDRKLKFAGYYKMPAPQTEQENCVAHNGSLIPVPGRDIMVQAWYQGGVSVFDFTDSAKPVEIAFFDRGPIDAHASDHRPGYWSTYWYNGFIYGDRDRARHRRLQADAERVPVAERDRRGAAREDDRVQRPAAAEGHLAGQLRGRARLSRPAHARATPSSRRGPRPSPLRSSAWTGSTRDATRARPRCLTSSTRSPSSSRAMPGRPPDATRSACGRWPVRSRGARQGCAERP